MKQHVQLVISWPSSCVRLGWCGISPWGREQVTNKSQLPGASHLLVGCLLFIPRLTLETRIGLEGTFLEPVGRRPLAAFWVGLLVALIPFCSFFQANRSRKAEVGIFACA